MKYGVRKPNVKKSIKARTTGKVKRQVKKAVNPLYGKKGIGIVNDPKKAAYNAVYSRTTVGVSDVMKSASSGNGHRPHDTRHTCISLLTEKEVDERFIKKIVGHKGQGVTENVYTHIELPTKLEAINLI